jgi:hypothetical protein
MRPYQRLSLHTAFAALMMLFVGPAYAAVTPGETFLYDWTETTGANPGLTGTVDFTLGPASTMSGFFTIASFQVSGPGGFCGVCTPLTTNLSGELFDAATLGVVGDVTGTFKASGGGLHTFDLIVTNLPDGAWTYENTGPAGSACSATCTSTGTYTTAVAAVDEPATLLLLIPAGVGLLISLRRRRRAVS